MSAYLHGALGAAIGLVSATPACAEDVTVYGLAEGAPCLTENMMPSSEDSGHPVFPYPAQRVAPNIVEITFNGKSCYYDISKVALDKIPPPCGKVAQTQGKTLGVRRTPQDTGTFVRVDGKRCTP
jgi:hypothetical protein